MADCCLGKQPAVRDQRVAALRTLVQSDPAPDQCNWWAKVGEWPMLANDSIGDCCEAAALHCIQQRNAYAGKPVAFTDDDAIRLYAAWAGYDPTRPETNQGTVMSAAMAAWVSSGVPLGDGADKLTAYATVDHLSIPWLQRAIWRCGSVLLGIQCPTAWLQADYLLDLPNGQRGDVAGGHAVLMVGYEPTALGLEIDCITWGARYRMTEQALLLVADEAFAVLDRDWCDSAGIDPAGVDWAAAETAMAQIRSGA